MTWAAKVPQGMSITERNNRIFERVFNGAKNSDVASEFGISPTRVSQIYKKKWKEYCSMPSGEKIVENIGKDKLIKIGHDVYEGHYTEKNGHVVTKRFKGKTAKDDWICWRLSRIQDKADYAVSHSQETGSMPTEENEPIALPAPEPADLYILRSTEVTGEQVLFKDLDKALYISEMMTRVTGVKTEVVEYNEPVFWQGEA